MIKINLIEHLSHGRDEVGPEITLLGMGFGSGSCGLGSGFLGLAPTSPAHGCACPGHLVPPRVGHGWHTDAQQPMSHLSSSTQLQEGTMPAPWQGWPLAGGSTAARAHHAQTVVAPSRDGSSFAVPQPAEDVSRALSRHGRTPAEGLLIACDV